MPRLMRVDVFSLRMLQYDYATQAVIESRQAWLLTACAVHCNLDFGLCAKYVGGEYTAKWRGAEVIPGAVRGLVSEVCLDHMRRVVDHGCPSKFNLEEPAKTKEAFIHEENNPSVKKNMEVVLKMMNDNGRKSRAIPISSLGCAGYLK